MLVISSSGADVVGCSWNSCRTYTLTYQICEVLNPLNCDQAIVTVTVTSASIIANDDNGAAVNGYTGGTSFANVLVNDELNGVAVNPAEVILTFVSSTNAGVTLSGADVVVAAGTAAGTYTLTYQICEVLNPLNCDQAIVTVTVASASIIANDDNGATVNGYTGGTSFTNVLVNDELNGIAVNPAEVILTFVSSTNAGVSLSGADVVVAAGTLAGNYILTYQICEVLNPSNCDQAIVTIVVTDDEDPTINCPSTITVNCSTEIPSPFTTLLEFISAGGSADDYNGIDTASFTLVSQTNDYLSCPETISRIYSISDLSGNSATCTQLIIVHDTIVPVINPLPSVSTIYCPATPMFMIATATDNCNIPFALTYADVTTPGACAGSYSITRTWTATDACGNTSTASQTINVQDITAPVIDALPATTTIDCPAAPSFAVATATDNCGSAFTLNLL